MGQFAPNLSDALQYEVPANAATVVCGNATTLLILNPASALAALTVTLPSAPIDGQRITIAAGALITLLTVNGGTIKGGISTLALNGFARYAYSAAADAWFRAG